MLFDGEDLIETKKDETGRVISKTYKHDEYCKAEDYVKDGYRHYCVYEIASFGGLIKTCKYWTEKFEYDSRNNVIKEYIINKKNEIVKENTFVYTYDNFGNIIKKENYFEDERTNYIEKFCYEYNEQGQVTKQYSVKENGVKYCRRTIEYKDGIKLKEVNYFPEYDTPPRVIETIEYYYDGNKLIEEKILSEDNEISKFYVYSYDGNSVTKELFNPQKGKYKWSYSGEKDSDPDYVLHEKVLTPEMLYEILDYNARIYPERRHIYIDELNVDTGSYWHENEILLEFFKFKFGISVIMTW